MIRPSALKKGDKIGLVATARKVSPEEMAPAIGFLEKRGYEVVVPKGLYDSDHQFAGNDAHRARILQTMLDDPDIHMILFARGGYGTVRIIDQLDFSGLMSNPKWLVGYSDLTILLNHVVEHCHISTIHGPMALGWDKLTHDALSCLLASLESGPQDLQWGSDSLSGSGMAHGPLVGGNLSMLYSMLGSSSFPKTKGSILFIEDLDEYLYHIDRMMFALKRAGILDGLAGLIVGGMTEMNDNSVPFGKDAISIISDMAKAFHFPVATGCPAGHIRNNHSLVLGSEVTLTVDKWYSSLRYQYPD